METREALFLDVTGRLADSSWEIHALGHLVGYLYLNNVQESATFTAESEDDALIDFLTCRDYWWWMSWLTGAIHS